MSQLDSGGNEVCLSCGACCREAFHAVELSRRDRFARRHPELVEVVDGRLGVKRVPLDSSPDGQRRNRCVCLGEDYRCAHYADRPVTCRHFEVGSANCDEARRRVGLSPLR